MASHISELADKSARSILGSTLKEDGYHENIMLAAGELVAHGLGHFVYVSQVASGMTVWRMAIGLSATVDSYGVVRCDNWRIA